MAVRRRRPHILHETSLSDVKATPPAAIARWVNEGGAPGGAERDNTSRFGPPIVVFAFLIQLSGEQRTSSCSSIDPSLERESHGYERTVGGHGGLALRRVRRSDGHQSCGDRPKRWRIGASHLRVRRVRS